MHLSGRRTVMAGAVAGALVGPGAGAAGAAAPATLGTPMLITAKRLRAGDLILGPRAAVVRVSAVTRLSTGKFRIRYTDPTTGASRAIDTHVDATGYASAHRFVLLGRGVPATAVLVSTQPVPTPLAHPLVIDGGAP